MRLQHTFTYINAALAMLQSEALAAGPGRAPELLRELGGLLDQAKDIAAKEIRSQAAGRRGA